METPIMPPSPTLTNPDMILPYGDHESAASAGLWPINSNDYEFSNSFTITGLDLVNPRNSILYGKGTILSDIGEVTEVEGTPTEPKHGFIENIELNQSQNNLSGRSTPQNNNEALCRRKMIGNHRRRMSNESLNSLASGNHCVEIFKDIQDDISVDDSVFQGDDEESEFCSDSDDTIAPELRQLWKERDQSNFNENASAVLSRRAEQILMNAKRRLNTMGGNLNRARSTIIHMQNNSLSRTTPSPHHQYELQQQDNQLSEALFLNDGNRHLETPFETFSEDIIENSKSKEGRKSSMSTASRSTRSVGVRSRSRCKSESLKSTHMPEFFMQEDSKSSLINRYPLSTEKSSAICLGTFDGNDDHYHDDDDDNNNNNNNNINSNSNYDNYDVDDDDDNDDNDDDYECRRTEVKQILNKNNKFNEDLHQFEDSKALSRSTSSLQMREIQYQMQDLKGRLSALKERTKDNKIRRRSLQSLRSLSPFTNAENSYFGEKNNDIIESKLNRMVSDAACDLETDSHDKSTTHDLQRTQELKIPGSYENFKNETKFYQNSNYDLNLDIEERNERYDDAIEVDVANTSSPEFSDIEEAHYCSVDEISVYEGTISHEDREDAFDYEHFFLHSSLGTISRQSYYSNSSDESIETTRGFPDFENRMPYSHRLPTHYRSSSTDTLSTIASFATATEDLDIDDVNQNSNEVDDFAVQCLQMHPVQKTSSLDLELNSRYCIETQKPDRMQIMDHSYGVPNGDRSQRINEHAQNRTFNHISPCKKMETPNSFSLTTNMSNRPFGKAIFAVYDASGNQNSPSPPSETYPISNTVMYQTDKIAVKSPKLSTVDKLSNDDQILIGRLIDSLGECVLTLQESKQSTESLKWRRRMDTARRVLEGLEGAV